LSRFYLYGIIATEEEANLDVPGLEDTSPVRIIACDGLGCVVTGYEGENLTSLSQEELVHSLLRHQRVVEQVMQDRTVLPVKFGTILENSQDVDQLLSQARLELAQALDAIRDTVEMEVAATWDTASILQELATEEVVVRTREAIAAKGKATLEDQVKLGQVVKACMDQRRAGYRERMVSFIKPLSVDSVSNVLVSDEMVMNEAFLVNRDRQADFDDAVQRLDQIFQGQINFRVIGPLPPYSFSTLEITRITPEQVAAARQTLRLPEDISEDDVRQAYRRLAAQEQRNLSSGDELAKARFDGIREASQMLMGYGSSRQSGAHQQERPGFLITIKRSEAEDLPHAPSPAVGA